ncbi:hypothetical protein SESBI_35911 [Sesbania bispinosa]|nr:hypothetical protein SESBI_35911 [Sesbania bispinosa]
MADGDNVAWGEPWIFSYYFQAKLGNRPVGWTSLNGFSGRPLLNVIHSSYKDFKPHYFRLRGTDANSELLFDRQGEPKFPLYWTKNPNRLKALKESCLTDLELMDVKLLSSFHAVDCNVLIEKEGDAGALQPYIVKMSSNKEGFIPTMDAKAMRAFSRTNKRKQGSQASEPVLVTETEHEVSSSTVSDKLVSKKTCASRGQSSTPIPPSPNTEVPQSLPEGQALLLRRRSCWRLVEEKILAGQKGRKEETDNLKAEISFQYEQGFEKAVDQVKFLHPEIVIDEVGAFKEIRDGKLVDIPDDEE